MLALALLACHPEPRAALLAEPAWQAWSDETFARARAEHKLILLSVQAAFCHWCHVMNATTYRDPRVLALLAEHFVVMRVDEAARPDLRERYAAWGWPATALLTPDAQPIVNLRGHQPPAQFAELLQRAIDGRQALAPIAARAKPASSLEQAYTQARAQLDSFYDAREGGWGSPQKYPFSAPIEEALWRGADVTTSLRGYRALIDPVAGGMFQYSLEGVWTKPHYEKLLSIQAGAIASFSAAHRAGAGFLADAQQVAHYALATLRAPDGAFYTSQAADVATVGERGFVPGAVYYGSAVRGTPPSLDTNVYADLNGMMIAALCELYRADGDATWLQAARGAHAAVRRRLARGPAFLHAANLTDAFYLSDQVELARAGYALSLASGEPALAREADATVDWTIAHLRDREGGFVSSDARPGVGVFAERALPFDANAKLARILLSRAHVEDEPRWRAIAEGALTALAAPARIASQGRQIADYLLALEQRSSPYVLFSVVGQPSDPQTRALLNAAWRSYLPRGIVSESSPDMSRYPYPGHAVVYLCSDNACSSPIRDVAALAPALAEFIAEAD
jgi:hypothetical protein